MNEEENQDTVEVDMRITMLLSELLHTHGGICSVIWILLSVQVPLSLVLVVIKNPVVGASEIPGPVTTALRAACRVLGALTKPVAVSSIRCKPVLEASSIFQHRGRRYCWFRL